MKPVRQAIVKSNQERSVNNMFAYVEMINNKMESTYSYVEFEISKGKLSIKPLKGMLPSHFTNIPISEIEDIRENGYYGWNRISFDFEDEKYIFVYSGYGGNDYLREHLLSVLSS